MHQRHAAAVRIASLMACLLAAAATTHAQRVIALQPPVVDLPIWGACISADGSTISGTSDRGGVRWRNGQLEFLPELSGHPFVAGDFLSADGTVVAGHGPKYNTVPRTLMRWSDASGYQEIAPPAGTPFNDGDIAGMSLDGQTIAGTFLEAPEFTQVVAFRWRKETGSVILDPLPGEARSESICLSHDGRVVIGKSYQFSSGWEASKLVRWVDAGPPQPLGDWPGATFMYPRSTNADGSLIMVSTHTPGKPAELVRWTQRGGYEFVGQWPDATWIEVSALNADGTAGFGTMQVFGEFFQRAIRWSQSNGIEPIDQLLKSAGMSLFGWRPMFATSMRQDGQTIAIDALDWQYYYASLLVDFSAPPCRADCDFSGTHDINDFIWYQTLFAMAHPDADCNADATLTIDDFICFQTLFAMGC